MRLRSLIASVVLLTASVAAHADELFTLTSSATTITFTLPSPTVPGYSDNLLVAFDNVPIDLNGSMETVQEIGFNEHNGQAGGGLYISNGGILLDQTGDILFTTSGNEVTFNPGTYQLSNVSFLQSTYTGNFELTISSVPAATPEPSSLLLLGTGLLSVVGVARRRQRQTQSNPREQCHRSPLQTMGTVVEPVLTS